MVQPAVADVIGPAVTADNPDTAVHEIIEHRQQIASRVDIDFLEDGLQFRDTPALIADLRLADLRRLDDLRGARLADPRRQLLQQTAREGALAVGGQAKAQAKLRIIFEQ